MLRTHTCGQLRATDIDTTVTLAGWVNKTRNLGELIFVDIRDKYGLTQLTIDPKHNDSETMDIAQSLRHEDVIQVTGTVIARPDTMINKTMDTGEIELRVTSLTVLSRSRVLPFQIVDDPATSEAERMKYRFLDLRRNKLQDIMAFRAKLGKYTRDRFTDQ